MPARRKRGEGGQQVARVRDAGVGQHALHVGLLQRAEVADGHGKRGEPPHQHGPALLHRGKPEKVMRSSTAKAAALGAVDISPTTGAGAPW